MPELPNISAYIVALESRIVGRRLEQIRLNSAFVLRTLERALTDPETRRRCRQRIFGRDSACGAAFAQHAHAHLTAAEWQRLFAATRSTLQLWIDRLREQVSGNPGSGGATLKWRMPELILRSRGDGRAQ